MSHTSHLSDLTHAIMYVIPYATPHYCVSISIVTQLSHSHAVQLHPIEHATTFGEIYAHCSSYAQLLDHLSRPAVSKLAAAIRSYKLRRNKTVNEDPGATADAAGEHRQIAPVQTSKHHVKRRTKEAFCHTRGGLPRALQALSSRTSS